MSICLRVDVDSCREKCAPVALASLDCLPAPDLEGFAWDDFPDGSPRFRVRCVPVGRTAALESWVLCSDDPWQPETHSVVCDECGVVGSARYLYGGFWNYPSGWFVRDSVIASTIVCSPACALLALARERASLALENAQWIERCARCGVICADRDCGAHGLILGEPAACLRVVPRLAAARVRADACRPSGGEA